MTKKVSIEDIAKVAGVSRGTVSRAFNQRSDINKDTRKKVLEVARKLNYLPNSSARGLAKGRSECIGIVVPDLNNPYLAEMVTAIENAVRKQGLSAILALIDHDPDLQEKTLLRMAAGQVDGLIITPCEDESSIKLLNWINSRIPVVALKYFEGIECDSVMCNDRMATRLMIEHLIELKHERIAFLSPKTPKWSVQQRIKAYTDTLEQYNISWQHTYSLKHGEDVSGVRDIVKNILSTPVAQRPTAIFAYDDILAVHLMKEMQINGLSVPNDISVAGFDNILLGRLNSTTLTTVTADSSKLSESAVDILLKKLNSNDSYEQHNITLKPEFFARESTALCKQ